MSMTEVRCEVWLLHRARVVLVSEAGIGVPSLAVRSTDGTVGGTTFSQKDLLRGEYSLERAQLRAEMEARYRGLQSGGLRPDRRPPHHRGRVRHRGGGRPALAWYSAARRVVNMARLDLMKFGLEVLLANQELTAKLRSGVGDRPDLAAARADVQHVLDLFETFTEQLEHRGGVADLKLVGANRRHMEILRGLLANLLANECQQITITIAAAAWHVHFDDRAEIALHVCEVHHAIGARLSCPDQRPDGDCAHVQTRRCDCQPRPPCDSCEVDATQGPIR